MYIRSKDNISKRTGLCSTYYESVESISTEKGSTNKVLLYLGKFLCENWDMNLSEVEAAFRSLKTELGTRPIHHQKDGRIEAHLFYSVLAYAILKSITYKLSLKDVHISWQSIKQILKTHIRSDTMFNTPDGFRVLIRQTAQPEEEAKKIYSLLNIKIHKKTATQKFRL